MRHSNDAPRARGLSSEFRARERTSARVSNGDRVERGTCISRAVSSSSAVRACVGGDGDGADVASIWI